MKIQTQKMKIVSVAIITSILFGFGTTFAQTAEQILNRIDENMFKKSLMLLMCVSGLVMVL